MLYTIHHGEEGLGAPGCPRSDTCPRRKVAQRWPSDPSCEIDPHRFLVFLANRPFKFCYSNPSSIFFLQKTRPLHPIHRNVPPSSPASIPPPPGSHRPPSVPFAVAAPPLPGRCHRPSPCRLSAPPSARRGGRRWRISAGDVETKQWAADLVQRRRGGSVGGGSRRRCRGGAVVGRSG